MAIISKERGHHAAPEARSGAMFRESQVMSCQKSTLSSNKSRQYRPFRHKVASCTAALGHHADVNVSQRFNRDARRCLITAFMPSTLRQHGPCRRSSACHGSIFVSKYGQADRLVGFSGLRGAYACSVAAMRVPCRPRCYTRRRRTSYIAHMPRQGLVSENGLQLASMQYVLCTYVVCTMQLGNLGAAAREQVGQSLNRFRRAQQLLPLRGGWVSPEEGVIFPGHWLRGALGCCRATWHTALLTKASRRGGCTLAPLSHRAPHCGS